MYSLDSVYAAVEIMLAYTERTGYLCPECRQRYLTGKQLHCSMMAYVQDNLILKHLLAQWVQAHLKDSDK
jgi:hypothetical protein